MPVFIEAPGGRPIGTQRPWSAASPGNAIRIALVNNMPDTALEDTETQFFELLNDAAADLSVHLKLVALPSVPRGERALTRLAELYYGVKDLWNNSYDAVIVTGTEPKQPDLTREPYWADLSQLFDWAQQNTISAILSCLAAHAGALYTDGIGRVRLADKMFGVYDFPNTSRHALARRAGEVLRFPHSRWNGLPPEVLTASGYQLLTHNDVAGADCFVKQKGKSLFVHFQGHPEYRSQTLFKEYRRDIRRFLNQERETYPTAPFGYFDREASDCLAQFQQKAIANRTPDVMAEFPEAVATANLRNGWHSSAVALYKNWLSFVAEKKAEASRYSAMGVSRSGSTYVAG
jgi:homoserine O-succinyltransferase